MTHYTDNELFQQIAAGDEIAFTLLFHRYSDKLYSYSLKILHTAFWAEEAIQNLFLQLWQHRQTLCDIENPQSYLFRMAANRSIDILRANEKLIRLKYIQHLENTCIHSEEQLNFRESEAMIQQAIRLLPEKRKVIYQLRASDGLSYEQISEQLNISPHTVRNQLAKAVETIRAYLVANGVSSLFIVVLSPFL